MKRHINYLLRLTAICIVILFVLYQVNRILLPKYYYTDSWPATSTIEEFYSLEPDSIDVLFLGSSHSMCAFDPQYLYDNFGIPSYNLSTEQQTMMLSYYWLREVLVSHHPQAVFLDTRFLFDHGEEALNASEACVRKATDFMQWDINKICLIHDICANDASQDMMSYYFPNIRFHSRWEELTEKDFYIAENSVGMLGFSASFQSVGALDYNAIDINNDAGQENTNALMQDYLERIISLCDKENIRLVLVNAVNTEQTPSRYNAISAIAAEHNLDSIDFCTSEMVTSLDFHFDTDMRDAVHANLSGAHKMTDYLGRLLLDRYEVDPRSDSQWEKNGITTTIS